ncbi:MAG TPA: hypothetical protein VGO67_14960 [Verrucomicrobiae bacterium]|jgi:hypothetical protein
MFERLPVTPKNNTLTAMKCQANEKVLTALQQVVGAAVKSWLNENKAEVLQSLCATHADNCKRLPQIAKEVKEKH